MPRRFRVNLEKFADTNELEDEKSFVRTQFPNMRFSYWKYGEVLKIDHHRVMATSFAAVPGTYVLFNAPKLEIDPPINRRDVLKETYRKVGGKLSTLNLLVGYKVMNPETRQPFINASEVLKAQGEQVFNRWITLYPDTPAWAQMGECIPNLMGYFLSVLVPYNFQREYMLNVGSPTDITTNLLSRIQQPLSKHIQEGIG